MVSSRSLLFLICGLVLTSSVGAEDEVDNKQKVGDGEPIGASPDAQISFYFVEPVDTREIPAGKVATFLVGFVNKGEKDFSVHAIEPSFRYAFDYSVPVLNLTGVRFDKIVAPKQEATFDYRFIPNEAFIGRPLGFQVKLYYTDSAGGYFVNTVFNETITVMEDESAFNTETGFLFVTLAGLGGLIVFLIFQVFAKFTRKTPAVSKQSRYETGTSKDEVDYEWIPRSHLVGDKSPKLGSPRNRRVQKTK